jgi:hypothetical protein
MRPREVFSSIEAKTVLTFTLVQLPTLLFQSDRYKVVALCDISQQSLRHCGSIFPRPLNSLTCVCFPTVVKRLGSLKNSKCLHA